MSYILDALKRNASDAQVGNVPSLHTQAGVDKAAQSYQWWQPALAVILVVAAVALSFWLQPWNRQAAPAETIVTEAPKPDVLIVGAVDYSRFQPRSPVAVPQPEPKAIETLPEQPVNAGIADGEQEAIVAESQEQPLDEAELLGGDELAALFQQAVEETERHTPEAKKQAKAQQVEPLTRKSQSFQNQVPSMEFNAHSYSSDPRKRMVKVNGAEVKEGGWVTDSVQIVAILPNKVVLEMQGQQFSLPALGDW